MIHYSGNPTYQELVKSRMQSMSQAQQRYFLRSAFYLPITLILILLGSVYLATLANTGDKARFALAEWGFVLCFLAYCLHKASLSRIEVSGDGNYISAIPSSLDRKLWGQSESKARIVSGAELIFCRKVAYGAFDGFYILLRTPGASDCILWKESSAIGVRRRYWERIAKEIAQNNGLNTRLIQQFVTAEGVQETDWTAQSNRSLRRNLLLLTGLFPWMGIVARLVTPDLRVIALIGVFLWVFAFFILRYVYKARAVSNGGGRFVAGMLGWTTSFVLLYIVATLATDAFLASHAGR